MMAGAIDAQRWTSFIGEMFEALRKGGWCQLVELYPNAQSDNGGLTDGKLTPISPRGRGKKELTHAGFRARLAPVVGQLSCRV